ncbi:DUF4177 domain-containing protein [Halegenticoccus tardaugens]|uniref:DUF4177 domain-containing protein n=1 Tax=Halegenticoccus tardaugens TaxID=2071624 RepID=UPI00100A8B19|nr:DUF4177 domain-containing protein [Halegenticoccus tardaugens]
MDEQRRWEYETLRPPRGVTKKEIEDPTEALNELGAEGWELVCPVEYVGGGTKFLILKRPVDEERADGRSLGEGRTNG